MPPFPRPKSPFVPALPALAIATLLATGPAWAQGGAGSAVASGSRITQVTLYPGSATVERALRLAAGARQAVFACLPAGLDAASLQVASDSGVRVGELSVRQQPRELLGRACASPLDERIRALQDRVAALKAESEGIALGTGYLKRFGNAPSGAEVHPAPAAQIAATVQALSQAGQGALLRQHQIEREQQVLEDELKPLQAERDRTGGRSARVSTVQVNLVAPQGGELRLSYQVRGPSWQPSYRAALDTGAQQLTLTRQALVAQNTGEDWDGVALRLSTGQPGAATQGPLPRPWRVGLAQPVPPTPAPAMAAPMARARVAAVALEAADATPPSFDVAVFDQGFATEFAVPQKITVPSNGERVTLTLGEQSQAAQLLLRSTPALDASAYLIAQSAVPPGVWPAGPVSLWRDGAYVGAGRLDTAQLARQGLAFGRDELVTVRVEPPARQDGAGGFVGRRSERRVQRSYSIENRHRQAMPLQVLDAAPVSEHQDVRVESRYQPEPATRRWNAQPGTVAWEQPIAAGATLRFVADHVIGWPKDERLQENR